MAQILYSKKASKFISNLSEKQAKKITDKIEQYSKDPESLKNQVKKLQGCDFFRLRVDNYRVIFDKQGNILLIVDVGHRREIYK